MKLLSDDYGMTLNMLAKNGATVVTADSSSKEDPDEETTRNYIINQITGAPEEKPDIIVFDGYTNDAYGDKSTDSFNANGAHINIWEYLGTVQGKDASEFDTSTFAADLKKSYMRCAKNGAIRLLCLQQSTNRQAEIGRLSAS